MKLAATSLHLAALACAAGLGLAAPAHADGAPSDETARLLQSHRTERYNVASSSASIRAGGGMTAVHAPLATVRRIVLDYGHYADFMPRFQKSRIVKKAPGATDVYLQVPILHGAASVWAVTRFGAITREPNGTERLEGKMEGEGNVDDLRATWRLVPVDDETTIVKLELLIVPKLPLPGSLVTGELEYAADQAVSATRERAEARTKAAASAASATPDDAAAPQP